MLGLLILLGVPIGLSFHTGKVAPERGRSAAAWILLVVLAAMAGAVIGSVGEALITQKASAPAALVLFVNPVVFGCAPALLVVLLLHRLPVGAARLSGTSWEFDQLGADQRVLLSLTDGVRSVAGNEQIVGASGLESARADGECLVLDDESGARVVLRPVGLPSRETRVRFVEALHQRIARI